MKIDKKKQILEKTEMLFNRFGIKRTGMDEIANLSNVAKGTIYNYFGDKEGLFKELVRKKIIAFETRLESAFINMKDPVKKLKITLIDYLKVTLDNPFLSDKLLYGSYEEKVKQFLNDLDNKSRKVVAKIINKTYLKYCSTGERKVIIDSLLFALRGMNESIRDRWGEITIKRFEKEIDYLIKALLPPLALEANGEYNVVK